MGTNVTGSTGPSPLDKAAQSVMQALGVLYKEAHASDPSGQAGQAIQQIMQAVSEVANTIGQAPLQGAPDQFAQASQNVNQQMMAQPGPPPEEAMMGGGY